MAETNVYRGGTYRDSNSLRAWLESRPPEEVLEPDLTIVDEHHHLWDSPQRGRYLLDELVVDLAPGHKIVKTMFMECEAMYRATGPAEMRPVG